MSSVYDDTSWYPEYNTANAPLFDRSIYFPKKKTMAFRRKRAFRRVKRGKGPVRMMRKIARQEVNKNIETHFQDVAQNPPAQFDYTTGQLYQLTQPTVGDTDGTRTGDKITIKSFKIRGRFEIEDYSPTTFRLIIFKWLANDATDVPSAGDIMELVTSAVVPYYSLKKDQAGFTFVTCYDKIMTLDTYHPSKTFQIKLSGKALTKGKLTPYVQYNAGAITGTGNYYMLAISDLLAASAPYITFSSRCRFVG